MKASDNAFPSLLITEGTEPSAPAAGKQRLYVDASDHHLKITNSSGVETDLQTGASAAYTPAHGCRVKRASGDVSVGNNTFTVVGFDAEDFDTDSMHDNSTNPTRIVIPTIAGVTTGLWAISSRGWTNATAARTDAQIRMNAAGNNASGTLVGQTIGGNIASSGVAPFQTYDEWVMSAADYVELFVRTTSGSFSVKYEAGDSPIMMVSFLGKVS